MNMLTRGLVFTDDRLDEAHGPRFLNDESGLMMIKSAIVVI
jgi:hypothetical protein